MKKLYSLTSGEKEATRMFVQFCVLSGCDFLDSLPNMGIVVSVFSVCLFFLGVDLVCVSSSGDYAAG